MAKWTSRTSQSKVTSYLLAPHSESVLNSQDRQGGSQETRQVTLYAPMEPKGKTYAMSIWILTSKICLNWLLRSTWWNPEDKLMTSQLSYSRMSLSSIGFKELKMLPRLSQLIKFLIKWLKREIKGTFIEVILRIWSQIQPTNSRSLMWGIIRRKWKVYSNSRQCHCKI